MKLNLFFASIATAIVMNATAGYAAEIPFNNKVRLKVGQSIVLKGVRNNCDANVAPSFASLRNLPKLKTGVLKDGGAGTTESNRCRGSVPARAIIFKATKPGKERARIYGDTIKITVE